MKNQQSDRAKQTKGTDAILRQIFDDLSQDYDNLHNNWVIQWMRAITRRYIPSFNGKKNCLEIGCGTGLDAVWLIENGWEIVCTDVSPKMCGRTENRIRNEFGTFPIQCQIFPWSTAQLLENLPELEMKFDLIYSSMGALNCEPNLGNLLRGMRVFLASGGKIVVTIMNRLSWWNNFKRIPKLKKGIFRTRKASLLAGRHEVPVNLYSIKEIDKVFGRYYRVETLKTFPCLLPPPYTLSKVKSSTILATIARFENSLQKTVLRPYGDHILVVATHRS